VPRRLTAALAPAGLFVLAVVTAVAAQPPAAAPGPDCETLSNTDPEASHRLALAMLQALPLTAVQETRARMCLAWSHVRTGAADPARAEAERLLELARSDRLDPALRTAALRRAGSVDYSLGNRSGAVDRYFEALAVAEASDLTSERIGLLINMGVVRGELVEDRSSHVHFEEAQRLMESSGERQHEAPLLNNYGVSLVANGEPAKGLPLLKRALTLAEQSGNKVGIAHVTHSIGYALRQLGRLDEAQVELERALAARREIGARAGEPSTLLELSRVQLARENIAPALELAEQATTLAKETGDESSERAGQYLLSRLHQAAGDVEQALAAEREYVRMEQAFLSEQNLQRLAEFETRQRDLLAERELDLLRRDNEIQALQLNSDRQLQLFGALGVAVAILLAVAVVLYLRRVNRRLRRSNAIDDLTGLSNRRYMTKLLDWARDRYFNSARVGEVREGVLFLVDIDRFKTINDRFGHQAGDAVLVVLAERLRGVCRGVDDRVARWGGEEFLLAARGLTLAQAGEMAERLRSAIAQAPVRLPQGESVAISASIGFAPWPFFEGGPALAWQDALRMADRALYAAKDAGRNAWLGLWGGPAPTQGGVDAIVPDIHAAAAAGQVRLAASVPLPAPAPL
jgi:diguanylate cyclase (GGDEF)-like protein